MATAKQEALFAKRIGKAIAKCRMARGLTQEQIAVSIGVEQETISRFERGATLPSLGRLFDIAEFLDVPLNSLVGAGSARPIDQGTEIAALLNDLSEENREWVRK